jgi:hypothetical protein
MSATRPRIITIFASLMVIFGLAEVVTAFTHNFFGLHTSQRVISTCIVGAIGICYALAGIAIFTMKRRAATLAITLLLVVIAGRISMVLTGLYPVNSFKQVVAIIIGTSIAAGFAIFIILKRSVFL